MSNVDHLDRIKAKFDYIRKIRDLNNTQSVFTIPKYLFIKNILIFLEDEDITAFACSCKIFNVMVYNSFTFRVLLAARGMKATSEALAFQSMHLNQVLQRDLEKLNSKDVQAQLSAFTTLKDFLTEKSDVLEVMNNNNEKEIEELKKEIKKERNEKHGNLETIHSLEEQYETKVKLFDIEKQDHGETVNVLNKQYMSMIAKKDKEIKEVLEKKTKIQADKEAVLAEMMKIKEEHQKVIDLNEQYSEVLRKMRQMFDANAQSQSQSQSIPQSQGNLDEISVSHTNL